MFLRVKTCISRQSQGNERLPSKFHSPVYRKCIFGPPFAPLGEKKRPFFPPRRAPRGGNFRVLGAWRAKMDEKIFFFTGAANDCRKKCCPKNTFIKRAPRRPAGHFPPYEGRRRPSLLPRRGAISRLPPPGGGRCLPCRTGEKATAP